MFTLNTDTGRFDTKKIQKKENVYQCITYVSAHSKETIESMIFSLLLMYFKQNISEKDFIHLVNLLFTRLQVGDYHGSNLRNMFKTTGEKINRRILNKWKYLKARHTDVKRERKFFLHIIYHPLDISQ